jgi:hypothetical protein
VSVGIGEIEEESCNACCSHDVGSSPRVFISDLYHLVSLFLFLHTVHCTPTPSIPN